MTTNLKTPIAPTDATCDIFLDGTCSFCMWIRERIEPYDSEHRLRFLDYNDPSVVAATPFFREDFSEEMIAHTPEGRWLRGYKAWVAVLRVLPKLAWIARIASIPPVSWVGPSIYRAVARHRHLIPGAPVGCASGTCSTRPRITND